MESDLATTLALARRRGGLLVLSLAVGLAAAYVVTRLIAPTYEATATLFVGARNAIGEPNADLQYAALAQNVTAAYAELAETRALATLAARKAGIPSTKVIGHVRSDVRPGVQVLKLRARANSASLAARVANGAAAALRERVWTLNGRQARVVGVEVIDPAVPPARAASPQQQLNLLLGGLAGLLAGAALAAVRERRGPPVDDASRRSVERRAQRNAVRLDRRLAAVGHLEGARANHDQVGEASGRQRVRRRRDPEPGIEWDFRQPPRAVDEAGERGR